MTAIVQDRIRDAILNDELADFLTLPAYEELLRLEKEN